MEDHKTRGEMMYFLKIYIHFVKTSEEFSPSMKGCIWVSAEGYNEYEGLDIYSYYTENEYYELGVNVSFEEKINSLGWYSEWYDAGTVMICKL